MGRKLILKELRGSGLFSLKVDSIHDVSVMDQLVIWVWKHVVQVKIQGRLRNLVVVDDSSGFVLFEQITSKLAKWEVSVSNIIAYSFD